MREKISQIKHNQLLKYIITITSIVFLVLDIAFDITFNITNTFSVRNSLLYIFSHANIFHLALNIWALWSFKPRIKTCIIAFIVSFAVTLLPFIHLEQPTCGLSGFLLACFARRYQSHRINPWRILLVNLIFIPFPMFNWKIHLAAFFIAYIYYFIEERTRTLLKR